jgi:hypothetical protein
MINKLTIFAFFVFAFALSNSTNNVFAQTAKADYLFNNTRAGSIAGAPDLTDIGTNGVNTFAAATVDGLSRTVLQFPISNGLRLAPTMDVVPSDVYTIVLLYKFDEISSSAYKRILDFKNGASENGFYLNNGYLSFYIGSRIAGGTTFLPPGTYNQVVLTRNAAGTVTAYANGVQEFSFDDAATQAAVINSSNALRFFRDNEGSPEHTSGAAARIRLFDTALTAAQVAALDRLPLAPTAAAVTIGGRVADAQESGIGGVRMTLTDSSGTTQTSLTSPFGYYRFAEVRAGETYVLQAVSKRYLFIPQAITVMEDMSNLDFTPQLYK